MHSHLSSADNPGAAGHCDEQCRCGLFWLSLKGLWNSSAEQSYSVSFPSDSSPACLMGSNSLTSLSCFIHLEDEALAIGVLFLPVSTAPTVCCKHC